MGRLAFIPLSIVIGLLAGLVGRKLFELAWRLVDSEEPPEPEHRDISLPRLVIAQALEGAIFRALRGVAEHGARRGYEHFTGEWPGEEEPEPA